MLRNIRQHILTLAFLIPTGAVFGLTHSSIKTHTGFECGTDYELKVCGVAKYSSCPSKTLCAGSYDAETWKESGEWQCNWSGGSIVPCDAPRRQFLAELCARRPGGQMAPGGSYQSWGGGLFHYDIICKRNEFIASCENSSCTPLEYNYCPDETRPKPKTCQLRKTQAELDAYISSVNADIDYNSELYAANLGNFLAKIQDKIQMVCLIDKYHGKRQFQAVIDDLITKWEANFGEVYEFEAYKTECDSVENVAPKDVTFRNFTCSALSTEEVREGVKTSGADSALKRFYNNCFAQKAYELPKSWFEFHLDEINLLLGDVVASQSAAYKQQLENLKSSLASENIAERN